MNARRLTIAFAGAFAWLFAAAPATAHAFLDHADPRVGSTVSQAPGSVRLWFTETLEPAFSRVHVLDASGKEVDANDAHVDGSDATLLTVTLPALAPGTYRVQWRVVSVDTHVTEGDYTFEIRR
jgi:methionine-rich copper-binding protein CopC